MNYLVASILVLAVGPLLHRLLRSNRPMLSVLDGFNYVAISGLVLLSILPEALMRGGAVALVFVLAGLLAPAFMERHFQRAGRDSHLLSLVLAMVGLCIHSLMDGAGLIHMGHHGEAHGALLEPAAAAGTLAEVGTLASHRDHLPWAIVLHRLPVGLTIWLLLRPRYGLLVAGGVLALVGLNTVFGYAAGMQLLGALPARGVAFFQALVAGSLMHVVVHRVHEREEGGAACCAPTAARWSWPEGVGGVVGIGLLAALLGGMATDLGRRIADTFVALALQSAPALVLGYAIAGLMHSFLPKGSIAWLRRGGTWSQSVRGMAIGLPLPVCSCGVVPLYRTLIQRGAPAAAAMAFMVATPELGIDAVLISVPLLGVEMTVIRVVAAALVALLVGIVVGGLTRRWNGDPVEPVTPGEEASPVAGARWRRAVGFGFGELVDTTAPWILLGLAIAALADPLIDPDALVRLPPAAKVAIFALLGVPTYVCASGATPLVAVLLFKGVSPGAALAFLLTGPATNVTTFGVVGRLHGRRVAVAFSVAILALSIGLGLAVNALWPDLAGPGREALATHHDHGIVKPACLALLAVVYLLAFLRRGPRSFFGEIAVTAPADGEGETAEERGAGAAVEHDGAHARCGGDRDKAGS